MFLALRSRAPVFGRLLASGVAMLVAMTTLAMAHASLNAASPADGAMVASAPKVLSLTFSEPVSPLVLKLIRPDGTATALDRFEIRDRTVEMVPPEDLGRGTHVLTWRVVSADGHPIGGSVVFSIGEVTGTAPRVEEQVDWTVRSGLWLARIAVYIGLFIGVGGAFARAVLMPDIRSGTRPAACALAIGLAGAIASLGVQGLDALGAQVGRIADPAIWSTGLATSYGATVVVAVVALLLGFGGLPGRRRLGGAVAVIALILAALAPALSGHASAASPQWLMRPAVFGHALGIAVWIGALVPLGLALRRREPASLAALARFSKAMPWVLAVLVAAGVVLAVVQVETPAALLDTAYGRVFLVKLALLACLFTLAALNRWRLTDPVAAGDRSATRRLVRSIAAETLIVAVVFGVAATWRFTPPPRVLAAAAVEPATLHIHTAKAMADLTVTPGRTGTVAVSAVLMTADFGPLDAKEVTFVFANPQAGIEPFSRQAQKPGDGTWRAEGVVLPLAGTWTVRIDILITDFDITSLAGDVHIRP